MVLRRDEGLGLEAESRRVFCSRRLIRLGGADDEEAQEIIREECDKMSMGLRIGFQR
jgi:hypothetical protein